MSVVNNYYGIMAIENANPKLFQKCDNREITPEEESDDVKDEFDAREIFDLIRSINDPEHPLTLEELNVVKESDIHIDNKKNEVEVLFTPTIPHCSMATMIGLFIQVQLLRSLPPRFKVQVRLYPNTHLSEDTINKQLADKERIAAAIENIDLVKCINESIVPDM